MPSVVRVFLHEETAVATLFDDQSKTIAVIHLAPGERLEAEN